MGHEAAPGVARPGGRRDRWYPNGARPRVRGAGIPRAGIRRGIRALLAVAVLAGAGYGFGSWEVYDQVSRTPRGCHPDAAANTPTSFTVDAAWDRRLATAYPLPAPDDVVFASRDPSMRGVRLAAWWIPAADRPGSAAPAVVLVHGLKSCRREASVLIAAGILHQAGFSVFLMDVRGHGDSGDDDGRSAGGNEEYLDVLGGWDWVRAQGVPAARIGLLGFSFGAICSLLAGGQDERVAAVWADSAATTMVEGVGDFVAAWVHDPTPVTHLLVPGAAAWGRIVAGDDLVRFDPVTQVERYAGRHLAFVHGGADDVLPSSMAVELQAAAVRARAISGPAWIVPGAGHTDAIYVDNAGYRDRLVAFFEDALGRP